MEVASRETPAKDVVMDREGGKAGFFSVHF